LRATFRGRPIGADAERLVSIAEGGLERRRKLDSKSGKDERVHLARLRALAATARCPADLLLEGMATEADPVAAMIERTAMS
jgi:glutamate--cysteine ligase